MEVKPGQTLVEALDATVRCARGVGFWRERLPELTIGSVEDFAAVPLSSRVDLSTASGLSELIMSPQWIFRPTYPFHQNVCTFPFQVVAGEQDLVSRHDRMKALLAAAGHAEGCETLILASPPQFFFASDLCAEIFFEGHHTSIQDVTGMDAAAIRRRIEVFGAKLVVVATASPAICAAAFPPGVEAVITFRAAFLPELERLGPDVKVVDVYTLTEAPYLAHRLAGERFYRYDPDQFYVERSPAGLLTFTTLLWELMPFIRYQTYDAVGELRDAEGLVEITALGDW